MSLGKGLGALITATNTRRSVKKGQINSDQSRGEQIWQLPISSIRSNPDQPRKHFDQEELEQLAASIKEHGVLQPILVSEKSDGFYEIITGERRWRACKLVNKHEIPAIVKHLAKQQELEVSLIENIQRADLNPIEEAFAYRRLIDDFHLTQNEIADKVGKARPTVSNIVRLLDLPEIIRNALIEGKLTIGQGKAILSLKTEQERLDVFASLSGQRLNAHELEQMATKKNMGKADGVARKDPNIIYLEDQLRNVLGTKVGITNSKGKGRIIIEYYSPEELNSIIDRLMK